MLVSINENYGTRKVEPPLQNVYDVDFCKHYIFIPWIHFIEKSETTMVYGGSQHLSFATPVITV